MKFYVNKYPIKTSLYFEGTNIPEGTAFCIDCINGNMLELKPTKDIGEPPVMIDVNMLNLAFYETEYVE